MAGWHSPCCDGAWKYAWLNINPCCDTDTLNVNTAETFSRGRSCNQSKRGGKVTRVSCSVTGLFHSSVTQQVNTLLLSTVSYPHRVTVRHEVNRSSFVSLNGSKFVFLVFFFFWLKDSWKVAWSKSSAEEIYMAVYLESVQAFLCSSFSSNSLICYTLLCLCSGYIKTKRLALRIEINWMDINTWQHMCYSVTVHQPQLCMYQHHLHLKRVMHVCICLICNAMNVSEMDDFSLFP